MVDDAGQVLATAECVVRPAYLGGGAVERLVGAAGAEEGGEIRTGGEERLRGLQDVFGEAVAKRTRRQIGRAHV